MPSSHPADALLFQGAIIRFLESDLDDVHVKQKPKFGICVNRVRPSKPADVIRFFFVTSQLRHFESGSRDLYIIRVPVGTYACLPLESVIDLWQLRGKPLSEFRDLFTQGSLTQPGELTPETLSELLVKVQCSDRFTGREIEAITGVASFP